MPDLPDGYDRPIRVLSLEDDDLDAELVRERLLADGFSLEFRRARTEAEFRAALEFPVDIILSDFSLPGYGGLEALDLARLRVDAPFIIVSGAIGDERATETLKRGATDYVLKDRLERLAPAVVRALHLASERRRRVEAETERDRLLISEREARASAEAANRMKDEFLAVLSHELRTPLNAILGWAQMLASGDADATLHTKGLRTIERNARAQSRLIEDLLDISRVITGKMSLRRARISIHDFVAPAVESVTPIAVAKRISLDVETREGEVYGDVDRLQQVIWNLLSNAVKFTPAGGAVRLLAETDADSVVITVGDTGAGIEPEFITHVFERFRQADASSTRRQGGLGLGLAIVRHLVELHGGTVSAASEGIGHGSTFAIRLPEAPEAKSHRSSPAIAAARQAARDSIPELRAAAPSLAGLRVLVVDDERDARDLAAVILETSGAEVTSASSVAIAFEAISRTRFDAIVSDIGMPDVDGYAFMRRLRGLGPAAGGDVPAIALTAYVRQLDRAAAAAAGFERHLAKPVDPHTLVRTVAEITERSSAVKEIP